jgi:hypothetical protein
LLIVRFPVHAMTHRRESAMKLRMKKPQGFRLAAASDFYSGFTPGSGMAAATTEHLTLAFRLDDTFEPVVVRMRGRSSVNATRSSES